MFKTMGHVSRFADPRAPTDLTTASLDSLKVHPVIVNFRQIQDSLS